MNAAQQRDAIKLHYGKCRINQFWGSPYHGLKARITSDLIATILVL